MGYIISKDYGMSRTNHRAITNRMLRGFTGTHPVKQSIERQPPENAFVVTLACIRANSRCSWRIKAQRELRGLEHRIREAITLYESYLLRQYLREGLRKRKPYTILEYIAQYHNTRKDFTPQVKEQLTLWYKEHGHERIQRMRA